MGDGTEAVFLPRCEPPSSETPACPPRPSHCPREMDTGNKTARVSLWLSGLSPRTKVAAAALGWLAEALQIPTLSQSSSCHSVQRWALMGQQGQPRGPGPRGGLWPGAMQTCWEVWAGAVGVLGACPSRPSLQLLEASTNEGSVYSWPWSQREGALPPGRGSRQTVLHGLKGPAVSLCGRPHPPRKEGCMGYFLPLSLCPHSGDRKLPPPPPPPPISPGN